MKPWPRLGRTVPISKYHHSTEKEAVPHSIISSRHFSKLSYLPADRSEGFPLPGSGRGRWCAPLARSTPCEGIKRDKEATDSGKADCGPVRGTAPVPRTTTFSRSRSYREESSERRSGRWYRHKRIGSGTRGRRMVFVPFHFYFCISFLYLRNSDRINYLRFSFDQILGMTDDKNFKVLNFLDFPF